MKWLLVTTNPTPFAPDTNHADNAGWNIGDVFARLGVERVIRAVDPGARIELLNMDRHLDVVTPQDFDRLVLAGRPLFWKDCESFPEWTHVLNGWPGRDRKRVLAFGVGDCYALPRDEKHFAARYAEAQDKTFGVVLRGDLPTGFYAGPWSTSCPAAFCLIGRPEVPRLKLCNFMQGGAHYPEFDTREAMAMIRLREESQRVLIAHGFNFVAHTAREYEFARSIGWPPTFIFHSPRIEPYLELYASASHYIGNRMHGAVVLAGRDARALAIGWDSRLGMVSRAGCQAVKPSEMTAAGVATFATSSTGDAEQRRIRAVKADMIRAIQIFNQFAQ